MQFTASRFQTAIEVAPTAILALAAGLLASLESGSIAAREWLPYAILAALLLATCVLALGAHRPTRAAAISLVALGGFAIWSAISILWTPLPTLGREEALLALFYALAFAVPALTLSSLHARLLALASIAAVAVGLAAVATAALLTVLDPPDIFFAGRLTYPVTYVNANAAAFLVGFWPAVALAARRDGALLGRAAALGGGAAVAAAWTVTQSKGGALALALSALAVALLSPLRLRLLLAAGLAIAPSLVLFGPLTRPFRADGEAALEAASHGAGSAILGATAAGLALGALVTLADRRVDLDPRARRRVGLAASAFALVAVAGAVAVGVATWGDPRDESRAAWARFKELPDAEQGASHFSSLGSNRYDFWRVALGELERHPLEGGGSRSFGAAYLQYGKSSETPARAHSLPLEVMGENGIVGLALLLLILTPPLALALRRRARLTAAAAAAAATYWLVHASGDWIWTFPALGIPFVLLLGIASTPETPQPLPRVARIGVGAAALAAAVLFVPPLLSERLAVRALLSGGAQAQSDLRLARRLDPISVNPLVNEARIAPDPAASISPLQRAVDKEPESVTLRYQLGLALLRAGRAGEARVQLEAARRLYPRDPGIARALAEIR